jgi:hypothetical protein
MQQHKRANRKWTINEVLKLQREYELVGMDVNQIAEAHGRSANAIAHRLEHEEIIDKWSYAKGYDIILSCDDQVSDLSGPDEEEPNALNERIEALIARVSRMEQTVAETNASMALMFMSKNLFATR